MTRPLVRLSHRWQRAVVGVIMFVVFVVAWTHHVYGVVGFVGLFAIALVVGLDECWRWLQRHRRPSDRP